MDHQLRRTALAGRLRDLGVDAFLVTGPTNVRYLTGFTGSNGQVLVGAAGSVFLTDGRYTEQSRHEVPDIERVTYLGGVRRRARRTLRGVWASRRLGFEAHDVTVRQPANGSRRRSTGVELVALGRRGGAAALGEGRRGTGEPPAAPRQRHRPGVRGHPRVPRDRADRAPGGASSWSTSCGATAPTASASIRSWPSARTPPSRTTSRTTGLLEEGDVIKMDFGALYGGLPRRHDADGGVRRACRRS